MAQYVGAMAAADTPDTSSGAFLSAVLSVRRGDYGVAKACVERARELLGAELAALVGESYERAYGDMVRVQQLTELEETVDYSLALALALGAPRAAPEHPTLNLRPRCPGLLCRALAMSWPVPQEPGCLRAGYATGPCVKKGGRCRKVHPTCSTDTLRD